MIFLNMKLFGTDGIRGRIGDEIINSQVMFTIGHALAKLHNKMLLGNGKIIIGCDTRPSCEDLRLALVAGIVKGGCEPIFIGVVHTALVAYATRKSHATAGIMITASHNQSDYNGVKILDHNGAKIGDLVQAAIESNFRSTVNTLIFDAKSASKIKLNIMEYTGSYIDEFKFDEKLDCKIIIDCANGSSGKIAPEILSKMVTNCIAINNDGNGEKINLNCGSESMENLQQKVIENNADIGFAFDGDGDRLVVIDKNGLAIDGDFLLAMMAIKLQSKNLLINSKLVTTVMTNSATIKHLNQAGIEVQITEVGDRNIYRIMQAEGLSCGGENSGHIIMSASGPVSDAISNAIFVVQNFESIDISSWKNAFTAIPQIKASLPIIQDSEHLSEMLNSITAIHRQKISENGGRLVVRKSGTEPIIKIMIEHPDEKFAAMQMAEIRSIIESIEC